MSRTDKDAPYWVGASWVPEHAWRCPFNPTDRRSDRPCDLPPEPPKGPPVRDHRVCAWRPKGWRRRWYSSPPGSWINHQWNGPQRALVRVECGTAVAEYRASGEVQVMPSVEQHRHRELYYWS